MDEVQLDWCPAEHPIPGKVALVVDDELFARLIVAQVLLDYGYYVLEAGNASEAFDVMDRNPDISLLITDINMPGSLDGVALAREVRRERPHVGIVLVSGFAPPPDDQMLSDATFLAKPFNAYELMRTVHKADVVEA